MYYEKCTSPLCFSLSDEASDTMDAPGIPLSRFNSPLISWEDITAGNRISSVLPDFGTKCSEHTCTHCGISMGEICATGRVGCAQCYRNLQEFLRSHLHTLHGNSPHVGLMPRAHRERNEWLACAAKLREQIQAAIRREAYEEAARLRDELKALERKLH